MEKILVVGATGTTGNKVINELNNQENFEPVAMVRKKEQQLKFEKQGIQTVLADLAEDVTHVTKGIDKVIFAAGSKGKALETVDRKGAMKIVDASKKHKVHKLVMLSSIGADAPQQSDKLQDYLQAKNDADEYLANSGLDFTIVRPGTLNDEVPTGKIRLATSLDNKKGSIPRGDVAKVLVQSLEDTIARREVFEILNGEQQIDKALDTVASIR
ncbi:SDR family oxidoreductase [Aquimarina sp. AD1]|uniref:SDR family oxidoreductase n=1 Tax=Aquimarina sp. (strain AD1) TaxID=1714848 RepID=UPI000E523996|nr:SDR family oxidoreductase [Aquimarina sp. AD1]AXT55381.1 SDR family oxidoreductase [Aquimarina sp. AD1]RKN28707.1 NAD-dependent epimerase/dehydratase family protein [Aquimarina sp. AD1]